ncbi:hypothetical protein H103_05493, partial [Trichophyton rubrum CBS 288.86]
VTVLSREQAFLSVSHESPYESPVVSSLQLAVAGPFPALECSSARLQSLDVVVLAVLALQKKREKGRKSVQVRHMTC